MSDLRHRLARALRRLANRLDPAPVQAPLVITWTGICPTTASAVAHQISWDGRLGT